VSRRLACLGVLVALTAVPAVARADFGFTPGSVGVTSVDAAGNPEVRAGAHPDRLDASFALNTDAAGAEGNAKDVVIDLPAGFAGDTGAVPQCARSDFDRGECKAESQVGVMQVTFAGNNPFTFPIYDVAPAQAELAELGFFAFILPVHLVVGLRTDSDYGTEITIHDLPQNLPLIAGQVELWGVPAAHQTGTTIPRKPFLTNPTTCDGTPPTATLRARSWEQPGQWVEATAPTSAALTGCERLAFDPGLGVGFDTPTADSPSGLSVDVTLPQNDDPNGFATSQTRSVAITLPAGVTLSPGVAEGLTSCDDDQLGIGTTGAPACPTASKIGTMTLTTPALAGAMAGDVFLGRPLPGDRYRLFLTASGPGVTLKLSGSLRPDPETGQLFMLLSGLPQLPVSHIELHFRDGPRAPLATPPTCGAGAGTATVTPYSGGPPAQLVVPIDISSGPGGAHCPVTPPFAPQFVAGSSPAFGGVGSSFSMTVRRADGEQSLEGMTMTLPPGLTARVAHVARCPQPEPPAAACPPASRVGSVGAEGGAGASPLPLTGSAYLTGPYRGAPFGLALVLHAQTGPLDLGTVVVRATLRLDPSDASLTVATDPLPRMLAGVPLRLRTLAIDVDRRGFMSNPTSCATTRITASIRSVDDATARATSRFALGGCGRLPFSPAVSMAFTSRRELRRGGHPGLTIAVHEPPGQATPRSATIELPSMVRIDPSAVTTICTRERASEGRCPRGSAVGTARVVSPLLPQPLTGTVNAVLPTRGSLPDLWATVAGTGVRLSVRSTTSAPSGKPISDRFEGLPDIPFSSLVLRLRGGDRGLLTLASGLCTAGRARRVVVRDALRGANGKLRSGRVRVGSHPACAR
jgi:hypothetical protein